MAGVGPAAARAAGPVRLPHFSDVYARSHSVSYWLAAPWTFFDARSTDLSQMYGTAGASATIILFTLAHALARSFLSATSPALAMASLIFGSSSCGQLTLPCCRMFLPL